MTFESFKTSLNEFNFKLKKAFNGAEYFVDGPLNENEYFHAQPYRILWLMKEAYGDAFSYPEFFTNEYDKFYTDLVIGRARPTWSTVVYVTYSLLNQFPNWKQMDYLINSPETMKCLNKIAWVNIQKAPSETGSVTIRKNLELSIEKYGSLIKEQIELLNPDVIICGNTFKFIKHLYDFPIEHKIQASELFVPHYSIGNKLFLDPYHPSYAGQGRIDLGMYIDDIVRTVKTFYETTSIVKLDQC